MARSFTPTTYEDLDPDRRPSLAAALIPVLAVVAFLGIGSAVLGLDPHPRFSGASPSSAGSACGSATTGRNCSTESPTGS